MEGDLYRRCIHPKMQYFHYFFTYYSSIVVVIIENYVLFDRRVLNRLQADRIGRDAIVGASKNFCWERREDHELVQFVSLSTKFSAWVPKQPRTSNCDVIAASPTPALSQAPFYSSCPSLQKWAGFVSKYGSLARLDLVVECLASVSFALCVVCVFAESLPFPHSCIFCLCKRNHAQNLSISINVAKSSRRATSWACWLLLTLLYLKATQILTVEGLQIVSVNFKV